DHAQGIHRRHARARHRHRDFLRGAAPHDTGTPARLPAGEFSPHRAHRPRDRFAAAPPGAFRRRRRSGVRHPERGAAGGNASMSAPQVSVVIPVYNEEAGLQALFDRLYPALDRLNASYEVVFINDGSRDRSAALLRAQFQKRPDVTRVVLFNGNYGQHMAIMAGFERCRGERIVTLDADLQNPPEEIGKLLAEMDRGHDYVGSIRAK